jgi:hypothetical protein
LLPAKKRRALGVIEVDSLGGDFDCDTAAILVCGCIHPIRRMKTKDKMTLSLTKHQHLSEPDRVHMQ